MIINISYLEEITGGDKEMILEMLDLFISDIPKHIEKIDEFLSSNQIIEVGREAHKLKPTLQYVGLIKMFEDIKQIEEIAKNGSGKEQLEELVSSLKLQKDVSVEALEEKRKELQG